MPAVDELRDSWNSWVGLAVRATMIVPGHAHRVRWRRLLQDTPAGGLAHGTAVNSWLPLARRTPRWARPGSVWMVTGAAGTLGLIVGGPVAALLFGLYAAAGTRLIRRLRTRATQARSRQGAVDAVAALAAELRAGVAVGPALAAAAPQLDGPAVVGPAAMVISQRVVAAIEVAQSSGAPLADVLDRLDDHLRAVDRAQSTAAAQAAGARASALLLAAMPVAGAGTGFLVGIDPLHTLWHTSIGAACLILAVGLQLGGLAWVDRLSRVEVPV